MKFQSENVKGRDHREKSEKRQEDNIKMNLKKKLCEMFIAVG